jgi:hypothetical protein
MGWDIVGAGTTVTGAIHSRGAATCRGRQRSLRRPLAIMDHVSGPVKKQVPVQYDSGPDNWNDANNPNQQT